MKRLTAALAASGVAALMLTGAGTAGKPLPSASLTACFDQQGSIRATVTWDGGRVTNGTFVAGDLEGVVQETVVQWQLAHAERSGTMSASLGSNTAYDLVVARLYAGKSQVAVNHFDVSAMTSC